MRCIRTRSISPSARATAASASSASCGDAAARLSSAPSLRAAMPDSIDASSARAFARRRVAAMRRRSSSPRCTAARPPSASKRARSVAALSIAQPLGEAPVVDNRITAFNSQSYIYNSISLMRIDNKTDDESHPPLIQQRGRVVEHPVLELLF